MASTDDQSILRDRFAGLQANPTRRTAGAQPATAFDSSAPLVEATDDELRFAFAANVFDLFRAMSHLPGALIEETDIGSRHLAFPFNPMFRGVWQTRIDPGDVDAAIEDSVAWFSGHGAPFAFWWIDPRTTPENLGDRLAAKGWVPWELRAPGMTAHLDTLAYDAIEAAPSGYHQTQVRDEGELRDFVQAFVTGFEVPQWAGQAWQDATLAFGIDRSPWRCYVGYLDGEPVASNMLFNGAGVASVFGVATAPQARRLGIGAAVTLAAFRDARQLGYRHGVLFATESGLPVYRRIGFRDVDATMSRYLWRADGA